VEQVNLALPVKASSHPRMEIPINSVPTSMLVLALSMAPAKVPVVLLLGAFKVLSTNTMTHIE
jgi:hypothetical protein